MIKLLYGHKHPKFQQISKEVINLLFEDAEISKLAWYYQVVQPDRKDQVPGTRRKLVTKEGGMVMVTVKSITHKVIRKVRCLYS